MLITTDPIRLLSAFGVIALYCLLCWMTLRQKRHSSHMTRLFHTGSDASIVVAYASQTGFADMLAQHTAQNLRAAGLAVTILRLDQLDPLRLAHTPYVFFVVSTHGEGDAPDQAALFVRQVMATHVTLKNTAYAILALGDRQYTRFCQFGHTLASWLDRCSAQRLYPLIEVDGTDAVALNQWQHQLDHFVGHTGSVLSLLNAEKPFQTWQLVTRRLLNEGSQGAPVFHLEFKAIAAAEQSIAPSWQAGDLACIAAPDAPNHPRAYSIASLPQSGILQLLVRRHIHPDGAPGIASGWLTEKLGIGETARIQLRSHTPFHLGDNINRPLIMIGNGTGIAGLHALLLEREAQGKTQNWLLFGERQCSYDFHYRTTLENWKRNGLLTRLDLAFSRDQPEKRYVQDILANAQTALREWIERDAAIYVCGSAAGMAPAVDAVLVATIGQHARDQLMAKGRYHRDIY